MRCDMLEALGSSPQQSAQRAQTLRYRLEPTPGQDEPELEWQLSLHPKWGVRLAVLPTGHPAQDVQRE